MRHQGGLNEIIVPGNPAKIKASPAFNKAGLALIPRFIP